MSNPLEHFRLAIAAAGLEPPDNIQADGVLHRFSPTGKRGDDAGWYVAHDDGVAAGVFGCWRSGLQENWCAKSDQQMTQTERDNHRRRVHAMKQQREAETQQRQQQAGDEVAATWKNATPATAHPYLDTKGVQAHGLRVLDGRLLVPIRDTAGALHSLQTIDVSGEKRFHFGGRVRGCYLAIGKPDDTIVVCEGYATGATIHEATGHAVAVAFNAGNLQAVAEALRARRPAIKIIVAGDDDWQTAGNPGVTKATAAALSVGGLLALPTFPADRHDKDTDFNDQHKLAGLDAVRRDVAGAVSVCLADTLPAPAIGEDWPDPTPLPDALPPVMPFDPALLPVALRGWIMDISHRMQCPPDFSAVAALTALSSLIGARAVVKPKSRDDWAVVPNLWALAVGRPGVMKSPAIDEAIRPLSRLEAAERERWQAAMKEHELDVTVAKLAAETNEKEARKLAAKDKAAARALLQADAELDEPLQRRYIVNDSTVEKLGEILAVNPWGTLAYRDELYGLLTSLDRPGQEGSRSFYLSGYDGNKSHTFDRIIRGQTHISRVCIAMLGGIQPGRVQEYVRGAVAGGAADDGLLQRFGLAVWPDVDTEFLYVDDWPDGAAKETAWSVFDRLAQLQPASDDEPVVWRFSEDAQPIFAEWYTESRAELKRGELHPALESHLSKYAKLIPALALIFALVDTPEANGVIHEAELIRALAWGDYLRSHAERLYSAAVTPEAGAAPILLTKLKLGKLLDADGVIADTFTPRQIAVKSWAGLGSPDAVRRAADLLVEFDWLRRETVRSGDEHGRGRPSDRYIVNPAALGRTVAP
jgi:putative DNA primase/helicase